MRNRLVYALLLSTLALALVGGAALAGGRPLTATLTNPDPTLGVSGTAVVTVNPGTGAVCYDVTVTGLGPATGTATVGHIHVGAAGTNGGVVVDFATVAADGSASGCTTVDRELALAILRHPEGYYINIHTTLFRGGVVRGQLTQ